MLLYLEQYVLAGKAQNGISGPPDSLLFLMPLGAAGQLISRLCPGLLFVLPWAGASEQAGKDDHDDDGHH
ncbi:MAG: hypothetical protein ACTTKK_01255, partial [Ottowia sp.]